MKVIHGLDEKGPFFERSVLTIGNFDGVHRGHQRIAEVARAQAVGRDVPAVALTFEPHPLRVLTPETAPARLTSPARKLAYLHETGIDVVVVAESTPALLGVPAEAFLREWIVARFHPTDIVEGRNFGFGRGRKGNVDTLGQYAGVFGYDLHVVEPVRCATEDGSAQRVSSSLLRGLLADGAVELGAQGLGRAYALDGRVVEGAGRGRSLGFPTANVAVLDQLIPGEGVYAARVQVDEDVYPAAVSIGKTPTFEGTARQVEAHLLDFEGDLYGRELTIHFASRLRDQRRFASGDELRAQIAADVARTREVGA